MDIALRIGWGTLGPGNSLTCRRASNRRENRTGAGQVGFRSPLVDPEKRWTEGETKGHSPAMTRAVGAPLSIMSPHRHFSMILRLLPADADATGDGDSGTGFGRRARGRCQFHADCGTGTSDCGTGEGGFAQ